MGKLNRFQNFKRRSGESIRGFWIRFETLTDSLDRNGLVLNQEMRFLKATQALDLSESQRMVIMAGVDGVMKQNDPVALKTLSVRIFSPSEKPEENFSVEALQYDNTFLASNGGKQ